MFTSVIFPSSRTSVEEYVYYRARISNPVVDLLHIILRKCTYMCTSPFVLYTVEYHTDRRQHRVYVKS